MCEKSWQGWCGWQDAEVGATRMQTGDGRRAGKLSWVAGLHPETQQCLGVLY